jgi:YVTN family beta-propeller protein
MKKGIAIASVLTLSAALTGFYACKHEPYKQPIELYGGFPDDVGKIITTRCATSGCHNSSSYTAAGNLRFDSWDQLFYGGNHGAAVVPYSAANSPILFYINDNSANGALPGDSRMPPVDAGSALSNAEYLTIKKWIDEGAPDRNGKIAFADNEATRQKIYVTQQPCDQVAVIDAERKVVMRYIKVGVNDNAEVPHVIRVSPDNQSAYVCFTSGLFMQKINTNTDQITGQVQLVNIATGSPSWNILYVTPDSKKVLACNYLTTGSVVQYDAGTMTYQKFFDRMKYPHGVTSTAGFDTMYVSSQWGNTIYKMPSNITDFTLIRKISLDGNTPVQNDGRQPGYPDPHEIMITPDGSKIVVTCQSSNEVKVLDARTNQVLKTFTRTDGVGVYPQEIAISHKNPYAYITCSDTSNTQQYAGSVFIFNYQTMQVAGTIPANTGQFNTPHGIAVDDKNDVLYVVSINSGTSGPPPHHITSCGGKNGYYGIFNSTPPFAPINNRRYEMLAGAYSADVRFK